jgi:hypothetical protein
MSDTSIRLAVPAAASAMPLTLSLALAWIAACAAAELIGMGTAAGVFVAGDAFSGGSSADPLDARLAFYGLSILAGAVEGFGLSWFRGKVLAKRLPGFPRRAFLVTLIAVGMVGWAIGMVPSTFFAPPPGPEGPGEPPLSAVLAIALAGGAAGGLLIGLVEAFVMRRTATGLALWAALSTVGWVLAFMVIFLGASTMPADWSLAARIGGGAATGLAAGAVLGLATLPALARLRPV